MNATIMKLAESFPFALKQEEESILEGSDEDACLEEFNNLFSMPLPSFSDNKLLLSSDPNNEFLRLTTMVRAVYFSHLHKCLLSNYLMCYKEKSEDVPRTQLKKCVDEMELNAVRQSLEASIYRQNMLKLISDIKSHTSKKKIFKKLIIFLDMPPEKVDAAVQTINPVAATDIQTADSTQNICSTPPQEITTKEKTEKNEIPCLSLRLNEARLNSTTVNYYCTDGDNTKVNNIQESIESVNTFNCYQEDNIDISSQDICTESVNLENRQENSIGKNRENNIESINSFNYQQEDTIWADRTEDNNESAISFNYHQDDCIKLDGTENNVESINSMICHREDDNEFSILHTEKMVEAKQETVLESSQHEDENSQDSLLQHMEDMFCESDDSSDLTTLIEKYSGVTKANVDKEIGQMCSDILPTDNSGRTEACKNITKTNVSDDSKKQGKYSFSRYKEMKNRNTLDKTNTITSKQNRRANGIWFVERVHQVSKLKEKMTDLSLRNYRKHGRVKEKFVELFGDSDTEDAMPDSPICIEEHLTSCKDRIAPWIVEYLMPFYKKRRIKDRQLFKEVAKHITDTLIIKDTFPERSCVSRYIEAYFRNKKFISSKQDIYM